MRISRFCEARGLYESDNSIESKIFCFGDDGPSGDSSSTAASEDIGTKDVDKGPRGQDTSSDREAYSDRFGGTSTRNFNIDRDQGFVDTDQGRVYGSTDVLSAGMASGDITPSGDQATADFTAGIAPSEPSIADFDTTNVPEFDEPAGAVSLFDIPGVTPPGSYAPTPVTAAARGPALGTTDYEFEAVGPRAETPDSVIGLEGPAVSTPRSAEEMALTGSQTFSLNDIDVFNLDDLAPVDLDEFPAGALDLAKAGVTPAGSPSQQVTRQATDPAMIGLEGPAVSTPRTAEEMALTGSQTFGTRTAASGSLVNAFEEQAEDEAIYGGRSIATPQAATLTDAERMSQQGIDAEMTEIPIGATAERREIAGQDPRAPDYTLAEAQANLEAAKAEAYRDKQFGVDTGLPSSIDVFGARIPTGIGVVEGITDALFNPDAVLANAIAELGIKSVDGASAEGAANYNPQGLEVVTSGGPVTKGGRTVAYDARGNVVYDSRGIGGQIGDLLTGNRPPENIQALYDRQRTIEEQQREMQGGDGGMTPMPFIGEEVVPEPVQEEYEGIASTDVYQYQPRGPISYDYTGLPSLAPTVLRPSYRPRGPYEALFPMGRRV